MTLVASVAQSQFVLSECLFHLERLEVVASKGILLDRWQERESSTHRGRRTGWLWCLNSLAGSGRARTDVSQ